MYCPNCECKEVYRKNPTDLVAWCDRCGHSWEVQQPQIPILQESVYMSRGPMKGKHYVKVWHCPVDSSRYSFSLTYGGGVCSFKEFPDNPFLSGIYNTPQEALQAGIAEVGRDD